MNQIRSNPPQLERLATRSHFSSAVKVGETVWASGVIGLGDDGKPLEGMAAQAKRAFENLGAVLRSAGATLADVVELVTYHTDLRGNMREFFAAKDVAFPRNFPCWTAVGVTQLAFDGLLVEVKAVAVCGSGSSAS